MPPREWEAPQKHCQLWGGESTKCTWVPACSDGCCRVLCPGGGLHWAQCELHAVTPCMHTEGVWEQGQASWFHWTLGFAFRMCCVCIISTCAWRLGTVGSARVGTGSKHTCKEPGMLLWETPGHSPAAQEPQTAQEPDTWKASRQDPWPFSPPASLPMLPVTSPRPELDGA